MFLTCRVMLLTIDYIPPYWKQDFEILAKKLMCFFGSDSVCLEWCLSSEPRGSDFVFLEWCFRSESHRSDFVFLSGVSVLNLIGVILFSWSGVSVVNLVGGI